MPENELPDAKAAYQRLKPQEIEDKLAEVHDLAVRTAELRGKYEKALAADDKERDRIREMKIRRAGL